MAIDPTMNPPVAPQNTAPAPSAPPAEGAGDTTAPPVPSVSGQPAAPPIPKGTQINPNTNAVPGSVQPAHGVVASIFQDLAGGQKTTWRQTENGPVPVKENMAPGEMARGILAAALTGLAAGYGTRGPGAQGKAISAGFNAVQEKQQAQDKGAQQQAEEQFKNKQTTDELTLRKMQNAREQQDSIMRAQEHDVRMDQMRQELEQGKTKNAQDLVNFQQKQSDRINLLTQAGVKPLTYPDGKPVEEFNTPDEALAWANKNSQLAIQPGKYNTIVEVDPHTNRYMVMQKPKGWDDPQWLGVETDSNGKPKTDKDGKFVPDGSFKDNNGKVVAPAGQLSPHQLYDSQNHLLELQTKELTLQEAVERLKTARLARQKDEQQNVADTEFNKAGGDPNALDDKGNFVVSPSSRTILQQRFIKDGAMEASILNAGMKEMEDPKYALDPAAKAELQQQINDSQATLGSIQANLLMLARTPNAADVLTKTLKTQHNGDIDAAVKSLDSMKMSSGLKDAVRQRLTATPPDVFSDPTRFKNALDQSKAALNQYSLQAVIAGINKDNTTTAADKQKLIQAITPAQPGQPGAPSADENSTTVQGPGAAVSGALKALKGSDVPTSTPVPEPTPQQ